MKKILMLVPLLVVLSGCTRQEDVDTTAPVAPPPVDTTQPATNDVAPVPPPPPNP
jgi:hypothetical protein